MKNLTVTSGLLLAMLLVSPFTAAEDRLNMQGTSVIGNQELPKVLYVVPWKDSELPDMNPPALESLIDEILQPLDREEFQREVNYYHSIHETK